MGRYFKFKTVAINKYTKFDLGIWYNPDTPKPVREVLSDAIKNKNEIRIWFGDTKTGEAWPSSLPEVGKISHSTGILKIPLFVKKRGDSDNTILDSKILRIVDMKSKKDLYKHEKFYIPELSVQEREDQKYPFEVKVDKQGSVAVFKSKEEAAGFISGQRIPSEQSKVGTTRSQRTF